MSFTKTWIFNTALVIAIGCSSWALPLSVHTAEATSIPVAQGTQPTVAIDKLPIEAQETIRLINRGGPFPYRKDGTVFGNFERRLPVAPRGTYREYTVPTPGVSSRGARRIITGRNIKYYTSDHYRSFRQVRE
jgi:ribonuclease T1